MSESPINYTRIIGADKESIEELRVINHEMTLKSLDEIFFGEYIVEPTELEKESIDSVFSYVESIATQYGSIEQFDKSRIAILEKGAVLKSTEGQVEGGVYNSLYKVVAVDRRNSVILTAKSIAHELFHAYSFHSEQYTGGDKHTRPYRSGISMHSRDHDYEYFYVANEAIVSELTNRYVMDVARKDERNKEIFEKSDFCKEWFKSMLDTKNIADEEKKKYLFYIDQIVVFPEPDVLYQVLQSNNYDDDYKVGFFMGALKRQEDLGSVFLERDEERIKFNAVIDRLIEASDKKIDRNAVFDEFACAHFSGNYLSLARFIEGILGQGSFREIAKELGKKKD